MKLFDATNFMSLMKISSIKGENSNTFDIRTFIMNNH